MTGTRSDSARKAGAAMTDELREAALAEIMGDVATLHQSVSDLVAITRDADARISARVVELRALAADLAGVREAMLAELAVQASSNAQRAFREAMGELLARISNTLDGINRGVAIHASRRFVDLAAVAIVSSFVTAAFSFGIAWAMHH